jgi:hypothetical protein
MCRFTGTFVDPSHEPVFAAQLFRMTYPTYVLLMAFMVTYCAWNVLVVPDIRAFWVVNGSVNGLGLLCRVLLHRNGTHDPVRSQWMGSSAWILLAALCISQQARLTSWWLRLRHARPSCERNTRTPSFTYV